MRRLFFLVTVIIAICNAGTTTKDNIQDLASDSVKKEADPNISKFDFISGCYQNVLGGYTAFLKRKRRFLF